MGYKRAGFDVTGVDLARQPEYPYRFVQGNALSFDLSGFDAVHASPPCQQHSNLTGWSRGGAGRLSLFDPHPDLIGPTRNRLVASGLPWIMENVPGAPLRCDVRLCGTSFGLKVVRHRWFELGGWAPADPPPACDNCRGAIRRGDALSVFGNGGGLLEAKRGMRHRFDGMSIVQSRQLAMGISHLTDVKRLAEAIPPAYTEWLGRQLVAWLDARAAGQLPA